MRTLILAAPCLVCDDSHTLPCGRLPAPLGASSESVSVAAAAAGVPAIKPAELHLGEVLDKGSYGVVYRAKWRFADVAVKVLRAGMTRDEFAAAQDAIVRELDTMRRAGNHPHVVTLLGLCRLQFPPRLSIVTELAHNGNLLSIVRGSLGHAPGRWPPCAVRRALPCT